MTNNEEKLVSLLVDLLDNPSDYPNIDITHIEHYWDWTPISLNWDYYNMPWSIEKITLFFSKNTYDK